MKTVVGSYGTATRPLASAEEFEALTDDVMALAGVDGLEVPYMGGRASPWQSLPYLSRGSGDHVLTMLPSMMSGLGADPALGLASIDDDGRRAAIELVRDAWVFVDAVNAGSGAGIRTVQLHSAPGGALSSRDAFSRSFDQIASWDWSDVGLAIEHCDADSTDHVPAKGLLSLGDELRVAEEHGAGVVINWGRSVIETRRAEGAIEHIQAAVDARLLTGVIFSGCAAVESAYGAPWEDRHVPIRGWEGGPLAAAADASLLTADAVERCVATALGATGLRYLGVKVKAPAEASAHQWVEVIDGNVLVLQRAIDRARTDGR